MYESEEKSTHRLSMPLPKTKHGDAYDIKEGDEIKEQEEEKLGDDTEAKEAPRGH